MQFLQLNFLISIKKPNFARKGAIDSKSSLVQVMAWRQTDDKPLPEPMMIQQFNDAYMRHTPLVR